MKTTACLLPWCCLAVALLQGSSVADEFSYTDAKGELRTVQARLAGAGAGIFALELDDGQWMMVEQSAVSSRKPAEDPAPIDAPEMARRLEKRFTAPLFVSRVADPFVVGVVLQAPLEEGDHPRVDRFLQKATTFLQSIERMFNKFADSMGLPLHPPRFPLVMLIFETDGNFNAFTHATTRGRGPSTENILGFYSPLTNWLAIRLDECDSFAVPLHEAIHQQ
ncbi:MAG: hypothetical protein KF861_23645, partial [Planctomycetaceae bacterium]|nr:hypothetical protein [Planctomycetaceae bacterium]